MVPNQVKLLCGVGIKLKLEGVTLEVGLMVTFSEEFGGWMRQGDFRQQSMFLLGTGVFSPVIH